MYDYIKKESEESYILAESTFSSKNSVRISGNYVYQDKYDVKWAKKYYDNNPDMRFEYFEETKEQDIYNEQIVQYYTQLDPLRSELAVLNKWFEEYDIQIQQYNRAIRLNLPYDAKYGTIEELDAQAIINSQRISELRKQIEELEKNYNN